MIISRVHANRKYVFMTFLTKKLTILIHRILFPHFFINFHNFSYIFLIFRRFLFSDFVYSFRFAGFVSQVLFRVFNKAIQFKHFYKLGVWRDECKMQNAKCKTSELRCKLYINQYGQRRAGVQIKALNKFKSVVLLRFFVALFFKMTINILAFRIQFVIKISNIQFTFFVSCCIMFYNCMIMCIYNIKWGDLK